ncbi:muscle M-line assembly protein unc-89 [Anopheles marshallii]|uniref:muscle M-line assembly protein unc-89 n=1 Tax=Anopheles marshallii TaxID=1521116 RepID=UPI00237B8849|nr:muscle M-line assembly protein unc-89 [Anopheles marshallii]
MSEQMDQIGLPPGWDCKYDSRTGRYYYVNLFTKTTQWEDPRARIRQLQTGAPLHISNDSISMQPVHGSPYHVYPSSNSFYPAQAAFQNPPSGVPSLNASPNLAQRLQQQQLQQQQQQHIEMSPMVRTSPRMGLGRQGMVETTFTTNVTAAETDLTVAKINSMFPTVPETHIRMLLKKYYNREAVVISALQVEKHPLTTPGPYSTPPLGHRPFHNTAMGVVSAFQMTPVLGGRSEMSSSRTGSPVPRPASGASGSYAGGYGGGYGSPRNGPGDGYRSSPKPHSSPKMKLRYMKSIFPKAEETLILDVLANADNNVQTASQQLLSMGYDKREQPIPQRNSASRKGTGTSQATEDDKKEEQKTPTPKLKSPEEKKKIKSRLQTKYKDTPEKIILMALESVDYSEERAKKILNIVIQEDKDKKKSVKIEAPHKSEEDKENARGSGSAGPSRSNSTASSQPRTPLAKRAHDGGVLASSPSAVAAAGSSQDPGSTTVDGIKPTDKQEVMGSTATAKCSDPETSPPGTTEESSSSDNTPGDDSSPDYPSAKVRESGARSGAVGVGKQNRPKAKTDHAKYSIFRTSSSEDESSEMASKGSDGKMDSKSSQLASRIPTKGPNMKLFKGPNDDLLLTDYVTWNGANPDLAKGSQKKATGPDRTIRTERTYKAHGPNAELCKGPVGSLAKGSMYTQLMKADVKCN